MGQHLTAKDGPGKPDKALFLLGWQTMDRAIWLLRNGSDEQLQVVCRDPAQFRQNLPGMPIVQFDQSAIWIKLRGEEGQIVCDWETNQDQESRRVARWLRSASTLHESEWAQTVRDQTLSEIGDRPAQVKQLFFPKAETSSA